MGRARKHATREAMQLAQGLPLYQQNRRRYRSPGGWPQWDCLMGLAAVVAEPGYQQIASTNGDYAMVAVSQVMEFALRVEAPARWLAPTLVAELAATAPPPVTAVLIEQLPAVHLLLPPGALLDDDDYSIALITVAADAVAWGLAPGLSVAATPGMANASMYGVRLGEDGEDNAATIHLPPEAEREEVQTTMERIRRVALGAMAVMAYEPELVSSPSRRPSGHGFGVRRSRPAPQAPTWIGRDLTPLQPGDRAQSGPGAGVRAHWRRGHWHTVRHGPGRQRSRLQWYRPLLVGHA
ncbi:hypothetical protein IQ216_06395 [Cyanobium sp. LEGE 06143]|uniref:hypothetical protein n=1 Tax=Cyanobium sp. LEGE 06143 TaxID=945727 RepID=UPI001881C027|nr:hypothetical protein [Cyanobium sp. LEGE 06143]MBE9172729.1 hypothetical protein [Cyanobium sp. LEGE 06143]